MSDKKAAPVDENKRKPSDPDAAPVDETTKNGPGRKPGSKNKPKSTETPRQQRKQPKDLKHTKKALRQLSNDYNAVVKRHNREHPNSQVAEHPGPQAPGEPVDPPVDVVESVEMALALTLDMVSTRLEIEARPDPKTVHACAQSYVTLGVLLAPDISPVWLAAGTALICTGGVCAPAFFEYMAREKPKPDGQDLGKDKADDVRVPKPGDGKGASDA